MQKNKFVKIIGILVAVLLVGGLVLNQTNPLLLSSWKDKMTQPIEKPSEPTLNQSNTSDGTLVSNENQKVPSIDAPRPVNPTKKAIVEVGSTGYNYFVINGDKKRNYEVLVKEFGMSYAKEDLASYDDIKSKLKEYIYEIANKHGVSTKNIHFVMSSGALKNPKIGDISKAIQSDGFVVNKVNADQEAKYVLNALVLDNYKNNSFYVDIGSGNTKFSWVENGVVKTKESFGAKYSQDGTKDADVIASIRSILSFIPDNVKQNCFIIGGIPYKLAKTDAKTGRYQYLRESYDMAQFKDDKDYQRIKNGYLIYNTIHSELNGTEFVFDHDANFSIGYLITL
jgi:hypothetical protein